MNEPTPSRHEMLESCIHFGQAVRDAGDLSEAESLYLIANPILIIAEDRLFETGRSPALDRLMGKIREIEQAHGLTGYEFWRKGEEPADVTALQDACDAVRGKIIAATFEEYGEPGLAALYRRDSSQFMGALRDGRARFDRRNNAMH